MKPLNLFITLASWLYLLLLLSAVLAYALAGDRLGLLGLLNMLAVYFFLPLPLVLLAAWRFRQATLGAAAGLGLLVFLWIWGPLFLPRLAPASASTPTLSVMTYNVLAYHDFTAPVIGTIRAENPDVVLLQELNRTLARAVQAELGTEYPYQQLIPTDNPTGMGVISKIPFRTAEERMPARWVGDPIILQMDWDGGSFTLVNFHMLSTLGPGAITAFIRSFPDRQEQAELLAGLVHRSGPILLGGDANSAPHSDVHRLLTGAGLQDAWREAGFGPGHTFPGSALPRSDRPKIGPFYSPRWLWRIDYVFASEHWEIVSSRLARFDGVSDHRGVVAVLRLEP